MRVAITVPDFPLADEPLRLGEWSVEIGDEVDAGESLAELICPGLAVDLSSPAAGIIAELARLSEQPVSPGEILGWLETESSDL